MAVLKGPTLQLDSRCYGLKVRLNTGLDHFDSVSLRGKADVKVKVLALGGFLKLWI